MYFIKILTILFLFIPIIAFGKQKSDLNDSENYNFNTINEFLKLKKQGKPVISKKWMVVTANSQASEAAAKILEKGLNRP